MGAIKLKFKVSGVKTGSHDEALRAGKKNLVQYEEDGVTPKVVSHPAETAKFELVRNGDQHEGIEFTKGHAIGGMVISRQTEQHFTVGQIVTVTIEVDE